MTWRPSRRDFVAGLAALAGTYSIPARAAAVFEPLYPPMDLAYFDKPISAGPAELKFGYASITWGNNDKQAIEDISALGFRGIQLRANVLKGFADPSSLRDLLQQHHLTLVALSSGAIDIESSDESAQIQKHIGNAKYLHDAGGLYLQILDKRPKRPLTSNDYKKLGRMLTEMGKGTADHGVKLGYHNHMHSMGEAPAELDRVFQACDPRYVKLELDIAHYVQGGGDPVKVIHQYRDRLLFLHIKDVEETPNQESSDGKGFRFVELGRGRVNLPATFKALHQAKFRGWAIIELDSVPDPKRSPKESALISKNYVHDRLGLAI